MRQRVYVKNDYVTIVLYFQQDVKVTEEQLSYTFLSLLAEIGGYFGLFLGISINQISNLAEMALTKFQCHQV